MNSFVFDEMRIPLVFIFAHITTIRLDPVMDFPMFNEVGRTNKSFGTYLTFVWPFLTVDFAMRYEIGIVSKGFLTNGTYVWLFAGVYSRVGRQMAKLMKRFATL